MTCHCSEVYEFFSARSGYSKLVAYITTVLDFVTKLRSKLLTHVTTLMPRVTTPGTLVTTYVNVLENLRNYILRIVWYENYVHF